MCSITPILSRNSELVEAVVCFAATAAIVALAAYFMKSPGLAGIPTFVTSYTLIAGGTALFALGCAKMAKNFFLKKNH